MSTIESLELRLGRTPVDLERQVLLHQILGQVSNLPIDGYLPAFHHREGLSDLADEIQVLLDQ